MTLYFIAGEASGDNHGAELMRSLRQCNADLNFLGRGGPQMKAIAGEQFADWIDEAAIVGLWEVIKNYGFFREKFRETLAEIEKSKPDAVVLIDYPGFNLRLARALRRNEVSEAVRPAGLAPDDSASNMPAGRIDEKTSVFRRKITKIIYYISPQVWAWHRGRIEKMARFLDLMLCIFPFEAELYNKSGLRTVFVGHPMVDRLQTRRIDSKRDPNLVGLFPGSRPREVARNFHVLHFEIAAASESLAVEISDDLRAARMREGLFRVVTGETAATMQRAFAGIVASGSATLEAAYFRLPFVLIYKVAWPTYLAARLVVNVKHLGMPNVLANKEVVPEFIQHRARPKAIAQAVLRLMYNRVARNRMISEFDAIVPKLGEGGASTTAARAIVEELAR
jgi:lipid-A-disaccharide synthase